MALVHESAGPDTDAGDFEVSSDRRSAQLQDPWDRRCASRSALAAPRLLTQLMSASSNAVRQTLSRRPALSASMSFRAAAAIAFLVFAANAAVSPLYRIYQARFGFSATTLTLLFAVYI